MEAEQMKVVANMLSSDVFTVLPMGFGKSLCLEYM